MGVLRKVIRGTAEIVFTIGLVGLLLCVHQLWWTNIEANADAKSEVQSLHQDWQRGLDRQTNVVGPPADGTPAPYLGPDDGPQDVGTDGQRDGTSAGGGRTTRGKAFAVVWIPRLGRNFNKPIVEGTSLSSLARGVGHYTYAPWTGPGQAGNFGLAGHRNGHGEPFRHLNRLRVGDAVVVETNDAWYTYTIIKGPYITKPSDGRVLASVPPEIGGPPGQHLITLTTCDPEFTSRNRMIYWGTLTHTDAKTAGSGKPAALR